MSGEIEAVGDLAVGASVARAAEPDAGEGNKSGGERCLNCVTPLIGPHCHNCGQKADVHRTLSAFWHDFTHSILHFEGKIWRTLPMLALRPGALTRRYVHGERAKFVSPLALFLFSIFLMFATFSLVGLPIGGSSNGAPVTGVEGKAALERQFADTTAQLARLKEERTVAVRSGQPTATLDARISEAETELNGLSLGLNLAGSAIDAPDISRAIKVDTGNKSLDERVRSALKDPKLLLYKVQSNAYKFSWALVILSIPFIWLSFAWRPQFHAFDHAVFVTYSLCFMTLLLVFMSFLTRFGLVDISGFLATFVPPAHIFVQLKGAYGLSVLSALWRTLYLLVAAALVITFFGLLLVVIGVTG